MLGACLLARWSTTFLQWLAITFSISLGTALAIIIVILLGGEFSLGLIFGLIAVAIAFLIVLLIWDFIACLISSTPPAGSGGGAGSSGGGLTSQVDCATAQKMLADAQARVNQLQNEVAIQAGRVGAAQQALGTARMAMSAAGVALAASFFFPWTVPAAIAAFAVATALAVRAARNLETELAALESLARRLAQAQRDLATAQGLVAQSCQTTVTPPPGTGVTVTVGTLGTVARGRGRRTPAAPPGAGTTPGGVTVG
jgi:hypothetical protein